MPFPEYPRVVYKKPALEEVICQLRFPDILRIGVEDPAEFQEAIRTNFPLYEAQAPALPANLPPQFSDVLKRVSANQLSKNAHDFISGDSKWRVVLASNFLALSTEFYERWEEFNETFSLPITAFQKVYTPSFYQRLGLRYRDVIVRSKLDISEDVPWANLIQPYIASELSEQDISDSIIEADSRVVIDLGEGIGKIRAQHFLANVSDSGEQCYVIDADIFYEGKVEVADAQSHLIKLNKYAGRFFRWCIKDELYEAMEPEPVE